jgi:hypothetical protein
MFLRFNICPEHRVHAGKVSLPIGPEPLHNVAVETKMNGCFPSRHDNAGAAPEVRTKRLGFGGIRAGLVLAPFAHGSNLAEGVLHSGRFLFHLCSLSGR